MLTFLPERSAEIFVAFPLRSTGVPPAAAASSDFASVNSLPELSESAFYRYSVFSIFIKLLYSLNAEKGTIRQEAPSAKP